MRVQHFALNIYVTIRHLLSLGVKKSFFLVQDLWMLVSCKKLELIFKKRHYIYSLLTYISRSSIVTISNYRVDVHSKIELLDSFVQFHVYNVQNFIFTAVLWFCLLNIMQYFLSIWPELWPSSLFFLTVKSSSAAPPVQNYDPWSPLSLKFCGPQLHFCTIKNVCVRILFYLVVRLKYWKEALKPGDYDITIAGGTCGNNVDTEAADFADL